MAEVTPRSKPSGTPFAWELRKPHPGLIQFVIVYPDGDFWVWRSIEFHDKAKVDSNMGAVLDDLPEDWVVETEFQRKARLKAEEKPVRVEELPFS